MAGIREALRRVGLTHCDFTVEEPDDDAAQWFFDSLAPGLAALGIDPEDYANRARASHLICRVRKAPSQPMILVGNMLPPIGGVSHVRVVHPIQAAASDPGVIASVTDRVQSRGPNDSAPRIFVLHRPSLLGGHAVETMQGLQDAGYLTITEFDDHPDHFKMMQMAATCAFAACTRCRRARRRWQRCCASTTQRSRCFRTPSSRCPTW